MCYKKRGREVWSTAVGRSINANALFSWDWNRTQDLWLLTFCCCQQIFTKLTSEIIPHPLLAAGPQSTATCFSTRTSGIEVLAQVEVPAFWMTHAGVCKIQCFFVYLQKYFLEYMWKIPCEHVIKACMIMHISNVISMNYYVLDFANVTFL